MLRYDFEAYYNITVEVILALLAVKFQCYINYILSLLICIIII